MEDINNQNPFEELSAFDTLKKLAQSRKVKKGTPERRVTKRIVKDGREYYLHATKGWRSRKL